MISSWTSFPSIISLILPLGRLMMNFASSSANTVSLGINFTHVFKFKILWLRLFLVLKHNNLEHYFFAKKLSGTAYMHKPCVNTIISSTPCLFFYKNFQNAPHH